MSSFWLHRFGGSSPAAARLFCFGHAGGAAAAFRSWHQALPRSLDVCAVQLPGRANRMGEPAMRAIPAMVDALLPALIPNLDLPFAFFGHSMGSALAYAVTHELARRSAPLPVHLFVSGRRPPRIPDPDPPLHPLSDADFIAEINRRYGGIPPEVLAEPDLMALLLPTLRADLLALETYDPPAAAPLPCPVSAFGGADDPRTPRTHLEAWRDETRGAFRSRVFPGGHFYLEARRDEVLADLVATLSPVLEAPAVQRAGA